MKPEPCYKNGLILGGDPRHQFRAGRLFPQPTVLLPNKRSVLLDEPLGSGFALVRLDSDPKAAFKPLQSDIWQKLMPRLICLVPAIEDLQKTCGNVACALDGQQQIARFLGAQRNHFTLIRPDRHVLGTFRADTEQAFARALREQFFA